MASLSRSLFLLLLATFLSINPANLSAQQGPGPQILEDIVIEGLVTIPRPEVLALLEARVGKVYAIESYVRDKEVLDNFPPLKEATFQVAESPSARGVILTIKVEENPIFAGVEFHGKKKLRRRTLKRVIPFKEGYPVWKNHRVLLIELFERAAKNNGFNQAKFQIESRVEGESLFLDVYIEEGPHDNSLSPQVEGNAAFDEGRVLDEVETKGKWLGIFNRDFNQRQFGEDASSVTEMYRSEGYLDAKVLTDPEVKKEKNNSRWIVPRFTVEEGDRYTLGKISVQDTTAVSKEEIEAVLNPMVGEPMNHLALHDAFRKIQTLYANRGYVFARPIPELKKNDAEKTFDLTMRVDEGDQYQVGRILIRQHLSQLRRKGGMLKRAHQSISPPTKDAAIMREVELVEGELISQDSMEETKSNLLRTGVFQEVRIEAKKSAEDGVADVVIDLYEKRGTAVISAGLGYNFAFGFFPAVSFTESNFNGQLDVVSGVMEYGQDRRSFRLGYYDRHMGDSDWSASYELDSTTIRLNGYQQGVHSFTFRPGRYLYKDLRGFVGFKAGFADFNHLDSEIEGEIDDYPIFSVEPGVSLNRRDDEKWPTRGYVMRASTELGYADGRLIKFRGNASKYIPLPGPFVSATSLEFEGLPYDADDVGITERVFMGGLMDMRGFDYRGIGPTFPGTDDIRSGGSAKTVLRQEIRFPIYKTLTGHVFSDAGTIAEESFSFESPRVSVGAGLKITLLERLLMGVDFGSAVVKQDEDDTQAVHFTAGFTF